jgi:hypothetical protein
MRCKGESGRRTYKESHAKAIKNEYEKELEVMSSVVSEARHPICAAQDCQHYTGKVGRDDVHSRYNDCRYDSQRDDIEDKP